ncbi:hypothetical protein [Proteus hauseri]|uniref:hypothetical protein n=1 Tax=Proteus hauseri TaxID=183417 RepID=UPI0010097729|nr:hypothetical protein [Proteus hauseri]QAV23950.1 hypothetical protein PH4a_11620 [Proteus hauseri]
MENQQFSSPKLVLEFFVREFYFFGKSTIRTQLPKDAFFYMGLSKAQEYRYFECVHKKYVKRSTDNSELIIKPDNLLLSSQINPELLAKIDKPETNTLIKIAGDYLYKEDDQYRWYAQKNEIKTNSYSGENTKLKYENIRSLAPHHFNIEAVESNGSIITNFPRKALSLTISKGETACFICRREEYGYSYSSEPALNLVMWVKNHGFYSDYQLIKNSVLHQKQAIAPFYMSSAREFDFRKSKLRFELG